MATKTFCDICGKEVPAARAQLMAIAASRLDLGDVCDVCQSEAVTALLAWKDAKLKTKATFEVVAAKAVAPVAVVEPVKPVEPAEPVKPVEPVKPIEPVEPVEF